MICPSEETEAEMAGRPKHAPEFKRRAVDPCRASGTTYAEVGRKLGVDPGSMADRVRRADSADAPPEAQSPFQMQEDLRRLRREAERLREENEIPLKASALFASKSL